MGSLYYCYISLAITSIYLITLLIQRRYRLILPSTIHTFIWMVTVILMLFQLKGILVSSKVGNETFNLVSKFIFFLVLSSVIGFILAHIVTHNEETYKEIKFVDSNVIDDILRKFKWIPYLCGIVGLILFIFLFNQFDNAGSFSDYRQLAISAERTGIAGIAQRISGHINILGNFYIMLLGYNYGRKGINLKNFLKLFLLCSMINISIGGRVWIVTSILPFIITFILTRHYSINNISISIIKKDNKKIIAIIILGIAAFSIIGLMRVKPGDDTNGIDKFLYLTDGSRITNMVLSQFPPGSYDLEYGRSTFLRGFLGSPMDEKFKDSISYSRGLSVTVKSTMPYLYYDFGYFGAFIAWGIICFVIELLCIKFKYSSSIIGIIIYGELAYLLFQAPVGAIITNNIPVFEWIILIYIFRKWIFAKIPNIEQYL